MRNLSVILAIVLVGSCAPAQLPPPASPSTPPPVPPRPDRTAIVSGTVVDARGEPVSGADIAVTVGDADCRPASQKFQTVSGARGTFSIETDIGMGAEESRCVFIVANAGGASASADARVTFSQPPRDEARFRLQLPRPPALTRAEADRVVDLFQRTLHAHDPALFRELGTYREQGEPLITGLNDISSALRGIAATEMIAPYSYRLTGRTGQQVVIRVEQDTLTRLESDVLNASSAAHTLMRSLIDVIRNGDADRLAAVAATDATRAREIIERYRSDGGLDQPQFRLRTIDETGHRLVYAFGDQRIELGYDGDRVWVRDM
jgi:hypothetical protein